MVQSASKTHELVRFLQIYLAIVLIDLAVCLIAPLEGFRILSKPLIIVSLIYFYSRQYAKTSKQATLIYAALCCSLLGDIILIYSSVFANAFILGLFFFLLAHISYSIVFWKQTETTRVKRSRVYNYLAILISYAAVFFYYMHAYFADLLAPVVAYMLAILTMALLASRRKESVSSSSFNWVLSGAIFFIISDSLLAINQFRMPLPYIDIWVMTTYATAQICIVWGLIKTYDHPIK